MRAIQSTLDRKRENYCQSMFQAADLLPAGLQEAGRRYATEMTRLQSDLPSSNLASGLVRWQRGWFGSVDKAGREFFSDPAWLRLNGFNERQQQIQLTLLLLKHQRVTEALDWFAGETKSCVTIDEPKFKVALDRCNEDIAKANRSYVTNRSKTAVPDAVAAYFEAMQTAYENFIDA